MEYMTVAQAAAELGMSARAVRNRIERGEMKAEQLNPRLLLIPRAEVDRWREIGRLRPGPKPRRRQAEEGAQPE
jgi:excisionase family DNA binding protein